MQKHRLRYEDARVYLRHTHLHAIYALYGYYAISSRFHHYFTHYLGSPRHTRYLFKNVVSFLSSRYSIPMMRECRFDIILRQRAVYLQH